MVSLSNRSTLSPRPFVDRASSITLDSPLSAPRPIREIPRLQLSSPSTRRNSPTPSLLGPENLGDGFSPVAIQNDSPLKERGALTQSPGRENLPIRRTKRQKLENIDSDLMIMGDESELRIETEEKAPKPATSMARRTKNTERRPRGTKNADRLKNGTLKGKITKPPTGMGLAGSKPSGKLPEYKPTEDFDATGWGTEGLQLEDAVKRRPSWTPIKDTAVPTIDLTSSFGDTPLSGFGGRRKDFDTLLSDYGFRGSKAEKQPDYVPGRDGFTKKQRVQLLPIKEGGTESQLSNTNRTSTGGPLDNGILTKATRKDKKPRKFTTITSIATAQYETHNDDPAPSALRMLRDERSAEDQRSDGSLTIETTKTKGKRGYRRKKSDIAPAFKVAPTAEALKSLEDQQFLFGTSSQLERDCEPSLPTNGEQKVQDIRPKISSVEVSTDSQRISSRISKFSKSKNHWGAASRDLDGALAEVEVVDLVSPKNPKAVQLPVGNDGLGVVEESSGNGPLASGQPGMDPKSTRNKKQQIDASRASAEPRQTQIMGKTAPSRNMGTSTSSTKVDGVGPVNEGMPSYRGYSTSDLAKKVAGFGFKAVKNREKMIDLLEKCWESQNKITEQPKPSSRPGDDNLPSASPAKRHADSQNTVPETNCEPNSITDKRSLESSLPESTLKPVQNKRNIPKTKINKPISTSQQKDQARRSESIVILDSENEDSTEETEPPNRSQDGPIAHPPSLSTRHSLDDAPNISEQISCAIKAQPRMRSRHGVKQPTWHEKIVMYDPICLEDLTLWLNTTGLNSVNEDREVSPVAVRTWCESKGICCFWKRTPPRT